MKQIKWLILLVAFFLASTNTPTNAAPLQEYSAAQLIAEVNAYRASFGQAPLKTHPILMSIAQAHSDFQAITATVTHYSTDGSRPKDRAAAAGYGGGATFFLSENIAGGTDLSPATAVVWWQGDAAHINTMLGTQYTEIGAGVGVSADGRYYYTIDVGWVAGSPASTDPTTPFPTDYVGENFTPEATADPNNFIDPVARATPREDGSIWHTVQTGQALYTIALIYEIPLVDLLTLNGLTENSVIYVGNDLLIQEAPDATLTPSATTGPSPTATPFQSPTPTATALALLTPTPIGLAAAPEDAETTSGDSTAPLATAPEPAEPKSLALTMLVVLIILAGALMMMGSMIEKNRES